MLEKANYTKVNKHFCKTPTSYHEMMSEYDDDNVNNDQWSVYLMEYRNFSNDCRKLSQDITGLYGISSTQSICYSPSSNLSW